MVNRYMLIPWKKIVCTLRGWSFQKQNRKEEEEETKQQQETQQFTQSYNSLHRLQVHHLTLTFIIHNINTIFIAFSSLALLSSSISTANLRCLLATTFSSLIVSIRFILITSLQSFESDQALLGRQKQKTKKNTVTWKDMGL